MSTLKLSTLSNLAGSQSTAVENAINGSAKAWVNFNGTGTVAIRASYNVTSITDNGTGDYTVNFTTALADANYSVTGTASTTSSAVRPSVISVLDTNTPTTTSYRFSTVSSGLTTALDCLTVSVAFFR